jgi:[ribosomal protein S5]-alanine N-acetyltransferase
MKLKTKRLILREWKESDIEDLIEGLNDITVSKWLAFVPYPYTKKDAKEWIKSCIKNNKEPYNEFEFAIELKSEKKVIGGVSLTHINKTHGTAGGGIWLNPKYQDHGYGSEAFAEKLRFAFEDLGLTKLENGFFSGNMASHKMQEKFGYKLGGTKKKAYRCMADGQLKDECITGLLKEDWEKHNTKTIAP